MPTALKKHAPAAERNREAIAEVLAQALPESGRILELASGTGQHACHFAQSWPHLEWLPTDADPEALVSIEAWRAEAGLENLKPAIRLDVFSAQWPVTPVDAIVAINLLQVSPLPTVDVLFAGASQLLAPGGMVFLYGPFIVPGVPTAQSNQEFDASLRTRNPSWGVRSFDRVRRAAEHSGFFFQDRIDMPASNFCLIFRKKPANVTLRIAEQKDDVVLGPLLVAAFKNTYAVKMPEVQLTDRRIEELSDFPGKREKGTTWVAEMGGRLIGTVFAAKPGSRDSLAWLNDCAELKHLAVVPEFRRSGLSETLMETALRGIRAWKCWGVCLHVRQGAHGVARYYEKQNFVRDQRGDFDRLPEVFLEAYLKRLRD